MLVIYWELSAHDCENDDEVIYLLSVCLVVHELKLCEKYLSPKNLRPAKAESKILNTNDSTVWNTHICSQKSHDTTSVTGLRIGGLTAPTDLWHS